MEKLHIINTTKGQAIIGIDPETRTVRWVEPSVNKKFYSTRQAAHRRREQLEERAMVAQQKKELTATLEAFLQSPDFKSGVISSTKASWSGSHYSVELFPDGEWKVLWANEIGNLYETPGVILPLPALDYDPSDKDEYVDGGSGDEDDFLSEQFYLEESENAQSLRDALNDN